MLLRESLAPVAIEWEVRSGTGAQTEVEVGDMEGVEVLILELAMFERRALVQHQFGNDVGERGRAPKAQVALEDRRPAAGSGEDEVARMRSGPGLLCRGDELQVNRRLEDRAGGEQDEGAVLEKGQVERGKRAGLILGRAAQALLEQSGLRSQDAGQAADDNAGRQLPRRRQLRHAMAVHENQARGLQPAEGRVGNTLGLETFQRGLENRLERQIRNRRHVGETPVLMPERRETQLGEARQAGLAQRKEPRGLAGLSFEPLEFFEAQISFFHHWVLGHSRGHGFCSNHRSNRVR